MGRARLHRKRDRSDKKIDLQVTLAPCGVIVIVIHERASIAKFAYHSTMLSRRQKFGYGTR